MLYQEHIPPPHLSAYVKCFWAVDIQQSGATDEAVVPDGHSELIFHYGDTFQRLQSDKSYGNQARLLVAGQITGPLHLRSGNWVGMVGVRFKPAGLRAFLKVEAKELKNYTLDASLLWGSEAKELEERLNEAATIPERWSILQHFLTTHFYPELDRDFLVEEVASVLFQSPQYSIAKLATQQRMSVRQLERRFGNWIGVSPKFFARIVRVQAAIKSMEHMPSMVALAHHNGFYDQAHLIREFKALTGVTPLQYAQQNTNQGLPFD